MKKLPLLLIATLIPALAGCGRWYTERREQENRANDTDRRITAAVLAETAAQGIITQHALFAYHFIPGTAELNEIGRRDLGVLARHWRAHGGDGELSVGDDATPELYEARLAAVRQYLAAQGVQPPANVGRYWPGGDGIGAERAAKLLEHDNKRALEDNQSGGGQPQAFLMPMQTSSGSSSSRY